MITCFTCMEKIPSVQNIYADARSKRVKVLDRNGVNKLLGAIHRYFEQVTVLALNQEKEVLSHAKSCTGRNKEFTVVLAVISFCVTSHRVVAFPLIMTNAAVY